MRSAYYTFHKVFLHSYHMKTPKITLILLFLCLLTGTTFSQTYYSENFNAGSVPAGFVLWDADGYTVSPTLTASPYDWTSSAWMIRPTGGSLSNYWVGSPSLFTTAGATADRWLCTPRFTIPSGATNVLLQWDAQTDYGGESTYEIRISTTDSAITSFVSILATDTDYTTWKTHGVSLQAFAGQSIRVAFRNITNSNLGYSIDIDNISVSAAPGYDMSVQTVDMYQHNWTGAGYGALVQGTLYNYGFDTVRSFNLNYSLNGAAPITSTITPAYPITTYGSYYYSHPILASPATDGTYSLRVWCSNINGNPDQVPANDTATSRSIYFYQKAPGLQKSVMLEEFTGAGSPYDPGGAFALREILAAHPDIVPVCIHSASINDLSVTPADAMAITDGETVVNAMCSGFPTAMIDRLYTFQNGLSYGINIYTTGSGTGTAWDTTAVWESGNASPVNVGLSGVAYDSSTNTLSATVNASFLNSLSAGDFRTNLYVIEDSVITSGNGYNQDNDAYSGSGGDLAGTAAGELYNMPTVVINNGQPNNWTHNHVLRSMAGGPWGTAGVIPSSPTAGSVYSNTYTVNLNAGWRSKFIKVIAVVEQFDSSVNNRQILNVSQSGLPLISALISLSGSNHICQGSTVSMQANIGSGYTYQWYRNGAVISGDTTSSIQDSLGGSFTVQVKAGGDSAMASPIAITVDTIVASFTLTADTATAGRYTTTDNSYANQLTYYLWSWGDGTSDSSVSPSHTYTGAGPYDVCLIVGDASGCIAQQCDSTGTITIPFPSTISVTASGTFICNSIADTLTATYCTGCGYLWSTGGTSQSIHVTGAGPYQVTVYKGSDTATASSGTFTVDTVVAGYTLTPDTSSAHTWYAYNNCSGNGPLYYVWSWGDSTAIDTGASVSHIYSNPGYFDICVLAIDTNGCYAIYCDSSTFIFKDQSAITVQVITAGVTGISNVSGIEEVKVYPNPSTDGNLTIELPSDQVAAAAIFDELGQQVMKIDLTSRKNNVNLSSLADGIYYLSFSDHRYQGAKFAIAK